MPLPQDSCHRNKPQRQRLLLHMCWAIIAQALPTLALQPPHGVPNPRIVNSPTRCAVRQAVISNCNQYACQTSCADVTVTPQIHVLRTALGHCKAMWRVARAPAPPGKLRRSSTGQGNGYRTGGLLARMFLHWLYTCCPTNLHVHHAREKGEHVSETQESRRSGEHAMTRTREM